MTNIKNQHAMLAQIERESQEVENLLGELIAEMERVPADQRPDSEWGPSGSLTRRFLELSRVQNELAEKAKLVSRTIEDDAPPTRLH